MNKIIFHNIIVSVEFSLDMLDMLNEIDMSDSEIPMDIISEVVNTRDISRDVHDPDIPENMFKTVDEMFPQRRERGNTWPKLQLLQRFIGLSKKYKHNSLYLSSNISELPLKSSLPLVTEEAAPEEHS